MRRITVNLAPADLPKQEAAMTFNCHRDLGRLEADPEKALRIMSSSESLPSLVI